MIADVGPVDRASLPKLPELIREITTLTTNPLQEVQKTVSCEADPLTCSHCGAEMKIHAFISEPGVIRKILRHRDQKRARPSVSTRRAPLELSRCDSK